MMTSASFKPDSYLLKNLALDETCSRVEALGGTAREARVLHRLAMKDGVVTLPGTPPRDISKKLWAELTRHFQTPKLELIEQTFHPAASLRPAFP